MQWEGLWISGCMGGIAFYCGREFRDHELLGFWDWPGLLAPAIGCALLLLLLQTVHVWYGHASLELASCSARKDLPKETLYMMGPLCIFSVFVMVMKAVSRPFHYWLEHLAVSVLLFAAFASAHHRLVRVLRCQGLWISGCVFGLAYVCGREFRDREKLGFWNWPGLIAPVVGCVSLLLLLELVPNRCCRSAHTVHEVVATSPVKAASVGVPCGDVSV